MNAKKFDVLETLQKDFSIALLARHNSHYAT